jgi:DNA-binding protein Alba
MSDVRNTNRPVIVGGKPVANYALAIQARLAAGDVEIVLRARGEHISRACDAANMAGNMGLPVKPGLARVFQEAGPKGKPVSTIEIPLLVMSAA